MTVLVWPNIDNIIETLLVAILIYCEVSIHCVIKMPNNIGHFSPSIPARPQCCEGWQQLGFLCPIWLTAGSVTVLL